MSKLLGWLYRILEMCRREHRLVLPPICLDGEEAAVILRQFVDDKRRAQSFIRHVGRRRDKYPEALRHSTPWRYRLNGGASSALVQLAG